MLTCTLDPTLQMWFFLIYIYTYVCVHLNVYFHMNWWLLRHSQRPCPVAMIKKTYQHVSWRAFTRRPGIVGYPPAIKHGLQEHFPIYRRFSHKRTSRIGDFHCHVWLPKGTSNWFIIIVVIRSSGLISRTCKALPTKNRWWFPQFQPAMLADERQW